MLGNSSVRTIHYLRDEQLEKFEQSLGKKCEGDILKC